MKPPASHPLKGQCWRFEARQQFTCWVYVACCCFVTMEPAAWLAYMITSLHQEVGLAYVGCKSWVSRACGEPAYQVWQLMLLLLANEMHKRVGQRSCKLAVSNCHAVPNLQSNSACCITTSEAAWGAAIKVSKQAVCCEIGQTCLPGKCCWPSGD